MTAKQAFLRYLSDSLRGQVSLGHLDPFTDSCLPNPNLYTLTGSHISHIYYLEVTPDLDVLIKPNTFGPRFFKFNMNDPDSIEQILKCIKELFRLQLVPG